MCYEGSCTEGTNEYYCSFCCNRDDMEGKTECDACQMPFDRDFYQEVYGFADLFRKESHE